MLKPILNIIISLCFVFFAGVAAAASGPWQGSDIFQARLVTATDHFGSQDVLNAGLEVKLKKGWKIYWRSPGDAGLPPELDFSSSSAVKSHRMDFPAPYRFSILGFDSYGYKDHVIFPISINLNPLKRDTVIAASFTGLVCDDVCIPVDETLTISLAYDRDKARTPSAEARDIAQFAALVPRASTAAGIEVSQLTISGEELLIRFSQNNTDVSFREGDVFIEGPTGYSFAKPEIHPDYISLAITGGAPKALLEKNLTITAVTPNWLLEETKIAVASANGIIPSIAISLITMIGVAFLGGVILNFMPCVLPVISLKLAHIIGMGGQDARAVRLSFLMTALGIVTSFILLASILLVLRQAGVAIGWGIQFQNIYFLGFAATAIALFAFAMLDVVTIPTPQALTSIGRDKGGYLGDFLTGFMATLLATPCSAPFVGTALTFALTASAYVLLAMFLAMGIGLALPWILVAGRPSLASRLPRAGPWLIHLKRLLSLGLLLTSVWLVSIMITILGDDIKLDGKWQAWSPGKAEELVAEGHIVLVDVTASWCLTCKANKVLVFDTDSIRSAFDDDAVKLLRADWTKPDAEISQYLAQHDRFGIPFNIVYGPAAPDGIALPELLTARIVKDAIVSAAR